MCGINGIVYKKDKPNISEVHAMNQIIKHRGPDDEGLSPPSFEFSDVSNGPVLLARRLPLAVLNPLRSYFREGGGRLS